MRITPPLRCRGKLETIACRASCRGIPQANPHHTGQTCPFREEREAVTGSFPERDTTISLRDHASQQTIGRRGRVDQQRAPVTIVGHLLRIHPYPCIRQCPPSGNGIGGNKGNIPSIRCPQTPTNGVVRTVQGRNAILKTTVLDQLGV